VGLLLPSRAQSRNLARTHGCPKWSEGTDKPSKYCPNGRWQRDIATAHDVVASRDDEQRRGIRRRPGIWKTLEPVHQTGGLRNFMRDFAVCTLIAGQKLEPFAGMLEIARCS